MNIRLTSLALEDLEAVRVYLSTRSAAGLANVIDDIETTVNGIPGNITRGLRTPHDEVWEWLSPKYNYRIPYTIQGETLYILRVYHPRRKPLDYSELLNLD